MDATYLSVTETAALVRAALKRAFPKITFSVRSKSYSGGSSIDVKWTDGPTTTMVSAVTDQYQGSRFDGMIDLSYSVYHWLLPDGSAVVALNPGTVGGGGSVPAERTAHPAPYARMVRFCADHVFTNRHYTAAFLQRRADRIAPGATVATSKWGGHIVEGVDSMTYDQIYSAAHRTAQVQAG